MSFFTDNWDGQDYFQNISFHHIEFYVGNAKQASYFYRKSFGFKLFAYSGPETGVKDKVSYVIKKRQIFFVFTTPLLANHKGTHWLAKHGDGVYNIAFKVDSVLEAYEGCLTRGAIADSASVNTIEDNCGTPTPATILVVQLEPEPIPIFTASAPASTKASTPLDVATLPTIKSILEKDFFIFSVILITDFE